MKKLFLCLFVSLACISCGDVYSQRISGPTLPSCASGFIRVTPNHCIASAAVSPTAMTAATCAIVVPPAGIAPHAMDIQFDVTINSSGVASTLNTVTIQDFGNTVCTIPLGPIQLFSAFEFSAVAAGTALANDEGGRAYRMLTPVPTFPYQIYVKFTVAGGASAVSYRVMGYYD